MKIDKGPRTVLMNNAHKIACEKFQRKRYFFHERDISFYPQIIRKSVFFIGQVPIKKYRLKTLFLLFNTKKIEKALLKRRFFYEPKTYV